MLSVSGLRNMLSSIVPSNRDAYGWSGADGLLHPTYI